MLQRTTNHTPHRRSHRCGSWFRNQRPSVIQGFLQRMEMAEDTAHEDVLKNKSKGYRSKRKAYLEVIRGSRKDEDQKPYVNFKEFLEALVDEDKRSTVAGALSNGGREIFITAQDNSIDPSLIPDAQYNAGYDEFDVEVVKAEGITGMHAEMQLVRKIIESNGSADSWYFAAAGKACCRVCAGMISALGGYYQDVSDGKALEYAWYDPFVGNAKKHPIVGLRPYVDEVGKWNKSLNDISN